MLYLLKYQNSMRDCAWLDCFLYKAKDHLAILHTKRYTCILGAHSTDLLSISTLILFSFIFALLKTTAMLPTPAGRILRGIYLTFDTRMRRYLSHATEMERPGQWQRIPILQVRSYLTCTYTRSIIRTLCASHYSAITRAFCNVNMWMLRVAYIMRHGDRKRY